MPGKRLLKITLTTFSVLFVSAIAHGQVFTDKQTRFRFAQMNLGIDLESSSGGHTYFQTSQGNLERISLTNQYKPRIVIGGTHFWGHADFFIAIPLGSSAQDSFDQSIYFERGVETAFKYYPWRIAHNKVRPYLGTSLTPFFFEQTDNSRVFGNGPELNHTSLPLLVGFTFNRKNHLVDIGLAWNYANEQSYQISRTTSVNIQTPPLYFNLSYRFMIETTLSAEKDWESGRTQEVTERLAASKKLSGWFLGAGMSSSFWLGQSDYNVINRPYIENYGTSVMPDFSLGYYLHDADAHFALAYRSYGISTDTYGVAQTARRKSLVLEGAKFLFDYHGFVPFIGPALSLENLQFTENFENQSEVNLSEQKLSYGITFGWDIRPNRIQTFLLRTNLRWFPSLALDDQNYASVSFRNIEFNFIQLIVFPSRIF